MTLTVSYCCCGCSLRSGTTIIAIYLLVWSIPLTVYSSAMLHYMSSGGDGHHMNFIRFNMLHFRTDRDLRVAFISGIILGILQAILNIVLLVGVHKEKKSLICIWIASYVVFFGLSLLSLVMSFFHFFVHPYYQLAALINIGLTLYFLLVVRSYYYSLADGYNRRQNAANVYVTENSNVKRMPLE